MRDRRKDTNLLDLINFNLLSPYTIQKMINGRAILKELVHASGEDAPFYTYQGMVVKNSALKRGIALYEKAIWKFLGNSVITRLQKRKINTEEDIHDVLKRDTHMGCGCDWFDIAGLISPSDAIENLMNSIENQTVHSLEEVNAVIRTIHANYYTYEWSWTVYVLEQFYGKKTDALSALDIIEIVNKWKIAVLDIDHSLYGDARKEFAMIKQTGFGVDGDNTIRQLDFESVRGEFETHAEVSSIRDHMTKKEALGNSIIQIMEKIAQNRFILNN